MSNDKIADLKAKFVAGATPQEADYATLLNMLEETRAATGTSPDAPKSTSLTIAPGGYMDVAVVADSGLVTGTGGLSVDPRLMWMKCHAIATGAAYYGMWDNGYVFIYILDDHGGRKVQCCAPYPGVWFDMGSIGNNLHGASGNQYDCSINFRNEVEDVVDYYQAIQDMAELMGSANTLYFTDTHTDYTSIDLYNGDWLNVPLTQVAGL